MKIQSVKQKGSRAEIVLKRDQQTYLLHFHNPDEYPGVYVQSIDVAGTVYWRQLKTAPFVLLELTYHLAHSYFLDQTLNPFGPREP